MDWRLILLDNKIEMVINGRKGIAEVKWIQESEYSAAHYAALISVPFQNSRWENLFVYNKNELDEALDKAKEYLEMALERCTLCG